MNNKNIEKPDYYFPPTLAINDSNPSFIDGKSNNVTSTDDFRLAVTLFHTGAKLLSVKKENSGKHIFIFKRISNLDYLTDKYWSDLLNVKAFSFLKSIKTFGKKIEEYINKNNEKTI